MDNADKVSLPGSNRLLAALPEEDYKRLSANWEPVFLEFKQQLYERDAPIPYVYFPLNGVCSLLIMMPDGQTVEVGTVGNEGMVGIPVFLGAQTIPGVAIAQIPGEAIRIPSEVFRREVAAGGVLRDVLNSYTEALFTLVAQTAACNRLHTIEQRCARWLLMTQDRTRTEQFPLTQEFLADMLGVRRASVSEVASHLHEQGLINYSRGVITVINRQGLEKASCECHWIVKNEFDRLLGGD